MHQNLAEHGSFRTTIEGTERRKQHEHPHSKRLYCMLWREIPVSVYGRLPLQPKDLEQLSIVYCRVKPYFHFMYRECSYYNQMIIHDVSAPDHEPHNYTSLLMCGQVSWGTVYSTSYILPPRLDSGKYLIFLQKVLPELLTDVPAPVRLHMGFLQDGEPSHYGRCVCDHLGQTFPNRWFRLSGLIAWPPRPLDLSPLDSFLWNAIKSLVYNMPVNSEMGLVARLPIVVATTHEKRPVFSNISDKTCHVDVVRAYMPMTTISNTFFDVFMSYFLFLVFLCNKAFYTTFRVVALQSLCFYLIRIMFPPMLSTVIIASRSLIPLQVCTRHSGTPCIQTTNGVIQKQY
ncbi:uncharacterized protein TNCV_4565581 [Trichonephila clavipes]|nr:uncharacterized protein TNCV_4565581 [Trichonephila clavipes]